MNGYELGEFKNTIIRKLIQDENVRRLLDPHDECEYEDDLIYKHIFPFGRVPGTEEEVRTYITVKAHVPSISPRNDTIRNVRIEIRVYAHHDMMRIPGESMDRIDLLGAIIDSMINEQMYLGIDPVRLESSTEHILDAKHSYREMFFRTDDINSRREGARQWEQS